MTKTSASFIIQKKLIKVFIILFVFLLAAFFGSYYFSSQIKKRTKAAEESIVIEANSLQAAHFLSQTNKVNYVSLFGKEELIKLDQNRANLGAAAFFNRDVRLRAQSAVKTILPKRVTQQLALKEKVSFANNNGEQHFYYQQKINGNPVYGAFVNLHYKNGDELYGMQAAYIENEQLPQPVLTASQAEEKALDKAKQEANDDDLKIEQSERYVLNKKLLGWDEDDKNYLVQVVTITSSSLKKNTFAKKYFVDLVNGEIIFEDNLRRESLRREIYDARRADSNFNVPLVRGEGDPPTGIADVDKAYDLLGEIYYYYLNNFNQKSYDDQDSPIKAIVRLNVPNWCPNAAWIHNNEPHMEICDNMLVKDIITHEFTHGVNSKLMNSYRFQTGTIDEALSDIMAAGLDRNWTMGEESVFGAFRNMEDPTKSRRPQPDRLFSNNYYCTSVATDDTDFGGVHANNGVINKMFYLMVNGGNFNGCTINGIGWEKALAIIYRYMKIYLTPTDNFRSLYNSLIQSCNDLYQQNSSTCINVIKAMRAVEIDQQPPGEQKGAKCLGIAPQPPNCALEGGETTTPPQSPPATSPTTAPAISPTVTQTPSSCKESGNVTLNMRLKFQGILKQPPSFLNKLQVAVTAISKKGEKFKSCGNFSASEAGIWQGNVFFDIPQEKLNQKFTLFVKGPKHLRKKICEPMPTETLMGTYQCEEGEIILKEGNNVLDFSKIMLLAGDLPPQDGVVNSYDTSLVVNNLGKTDGEALQKADINLDGIVNTQDYSLIIAGLSIRLDEL